MAKLTKEERAELEAKLAADDDDDADGDEIEVGFSDGSYVRGRYSRVSEAAAARGMKLKPDAADGDGKTGDGKPAQKSNVRRFQGGRRVS